MNRTRPAPYRFLPLERECRKRGYRLIAGLDEAGRGPWAGPLVCAAVILRTRVHLKGLTDSKLLRPAMRQSFAKKIRSTCDYGIGVVSSKMIDRHGLIKACEKAFLKAIEKLSKKPNFLLVDGNDHFQFPIPFQSIIRGDRRIRSIAAASVLAKVYRDRLMEKLSKKYPQFQFHRHKGYGTRLHAKLLRKFGPTKIHRFSFQPVALSLSKGLPNEK